MFDAKYISNSPPDQLPCLRDDTPPSEPRQESPGHVLDDPEVGGEEHHDKDEWGDERVHDKGRAEVDCQRKPLEDGVKQDNHLVWGPSDFLVYNPDT